MEAYEINRIWLELTVIVVFSLFLYRLLIRPQLVRAKNHKHQINNIALGSKIITNGGLIGITKNVEDEYLDVEFSEGIIIKVKKSMVNEIY